jgi:F0F1-type ATP synthase assembly protein I
MQRKSPLEIFVKAFPPQIIGFMAVQIALVNGALMLGGAFLGLALDRQMGTSPLWTLVLPLAGAVVSLLVTYRLAMLAVKRSRRAYLQWAETQRHAEEAASSALRDVA